MYGEIDKDVIIDTIESTLVVIVIKICGYVGWASAGSTMQAGRGRQTAQFRALTTDSWSEPSSC